MAFISEGAGINLITCQLLVNEMPGQELAPGTDVVTYLLAQELCKQNCSDNKLKEV
jgi:hypothetical protein